MDRSDLRKQTVDNCRKILKAFSNRGNECLQPDELATLHVKISSLDLETGQTTDNGPIFASPFSKKDFDERIKCKHLSENQWPFRPGIIFRGTAAYAVITTVERCLGGRQYLGSLASYSPWFGRR